MDALQTEYSVPTKGGRLPEAQGLQWEDRFFDGEEGLVAVFDFEYEKIASFQEKVAMASMLFPPVLIFGSLACYPCCFRQQIQWNTYSQHVAVTQDGIKYVQDKRKTACGFDCTDAGKTSKTVPFDKITDCDVTEPAGATCLCVDNVLPVVNVDTASSGGTSGEGGPLHELSLVGLKQPLELKKLVWAMKRAHTQGQPVHPNAPAAAIMNRAGSNEDTNSILRDIRSELKELNANIKNTDK
jgi:hypothetical protein|mmetsp:Transcript_24723/g.44777  ORF Transcript_24723/g.44777 Transcript_24723/m.44777 type:complete len:241 (-) Transcript_24723:516-1238(-)|eukprot:CAMPEP_0198293540 /NCGR_PEP_ID=MMETSP1449-20131203/17618_1 /TAXON_ID=420275 /ORGANISM="Attheya septentrionalis, Strain CCMP2084" /LENGTH=240 /DNA_ID=CAMNT_0043993153 /DNA_START=28 /DNA_END=750 /DNA_ORIENTATION=-